MQEGNVDGKRASWGKGHSKALFGLRGPPCPGVLQPLLKCRSRIDNKPYVNYCVLSLFFLAVLGIKPRALHMLGKSSWITRLHLQPDQCLLFFIFFIHMYIQCLGHFSPLLPSPLLPPTPPPPSAPYPVDTRYDQCLKSDSEHLKTREVSQSLWCYVNHLCRHLCCQRQQYHLLHILFLI
jgi:hypothetical protein